MSSPPPQNPPYQYDQAKAYILLFVQVAFIAVMFFFLCYWHMKNPDSVQVVKNYEMQLLKRNQIHDQEQENHQHV